MTSPLVLTERWERERLSPAARYAADAIRQRPEPESTVRTAFQRDRDRILHSKSFRRLSHKTQVFIAPAGDHYRTRLTHTLEVTQVARTIGRALLLNEDLIEAIGLGHDLGHTPFGHAGETALAEVVPGFRHNEQSLRIVDHLEREGLGLNLTNDVRDGILFHSKSKTISSAQSGRSKSLEGEVVRVADAIAYINHDFDDAVRAGLLSENDLPEIARKVLGDTHSRRIETLVTDVISNSVIEPGGEIRMSEEVSEAANALRDFLFTAVYDPLNSSSDNQRAMELVQTLWRWYSSDVMRMPDEYRGRVVEGSPATLAADYVASMTDRFAIADFERIYVPHHWQL